jgi:hypothetical protein
MESHSLSGADMDEEDGVLAVVALGLGIRVNEPRLLDWVGDDEDDFTIGDIGELEGLLDDGDIPTEELMTVDFLFAVLAGVRGLDVANGAVSIRLLTLAGMGMEGVG